MAETETPLEEPKVVMATIKAEAEPPVEQEPAPVPQTPHYDHCIPVPAALGNTCPHCGWAYAVSGEPHEVA